MSRNGSVTSWSGARSPSPPADAYSLRIGPGRGRPHRLGPAPWAAAQAGSRHSRRRLVSAPGTGPRGRQRSAYNGAGRGNRGNLAYPGARRAGPRRSEPDPLTVRTSDALGRPLAGCQPVLGSPQPPACQAEPSPQDQRRMRAAISEWGGVRIVDHRHSRCVQPTGAPSHRMALPA